MFSRVRSISLYILLVCVAALAQLPTGTILGEVKDSTGAIIPGASLTATNVETGQSRTAISSEDGSYRFAALPVGPYEVRVEVAGFQTEVRSGLNLTVSQQAVVNFAVKVGAVDQTITVTGDAPLVNVTTGSLGGLVTEEKIADLPLNGRNYIDLTLMQPGVIRSSSTSTNSGMAGTWFSSNGAPLRSNNYMLDGAPMQNFFGGASSSVSGSTLGVEGIREYRVLTNSFSAEYGSTMGSQTVLVSKNGTNQWHGSAFEYLRNDALDAAPYFHRKTEANGFRRLPPFKRNNFGGSFGGPIRKDKTFFFGTYEGLRQRFGDTPIANVMAPGCHGLAGATITNVACPQLGAATPSVTISPVTAPLLAIFPNPNLPNNQSTYPLTLPTTEDYVQIRLDQNFSSSDRLFGRYTIQDSEQQISVLFPSVKNPSDSRLQFVTLAEDHVFTPTLLNSFRLSYSRSTIGFDFQNDFSGPQYSFLPGKPIGGISVGGLSPFPSANPNHVKQNVYSLGDDLFYTLGRHSLKMGTAINHVQQYTLLGNVAWGSVTFPTIASFLQGVPSTYSALTPGSINWRDWRHNTYGFYVQDDLRMNSRLTVNLGLRYEFATQLQEHNGRSSALRNIETDNEVTIGVPFKNPTLKNFSPRFGFAWDPQGNGATALRAGAALLYDLPTNFGNPLNSLATGTPPFSSQTTVANPSTFTIPLTLPVGAGVTALRLFDYNLHQPRIFTYNLTVERRLPLDMAVTVSYAGSRGKNLMRISEGNPAVGQILSDGQRFWTMGAPLRNPNFGTIQYFEAGSKSWYNSLQLGLLKRLTNGLQFQSSYTWSKLIDNRQGQSGIDTVVSGQYGVDPFRPEVDRAVADFDVTHVYRFNAIYNLPQMKSLTGIMNKVVNGWWVSGIFSANTGLPFTVALQANRSRSRVGGGAAGIDRPDVVPGRNNSNITKGVSSGCTGVAVGTPLGTPTLYYDPCAFTIPAAGFLGTAGRNMLRAPGVTNVDFSLVKDMPLGISEEAKLQFRVEAFNLLNHPNFAPPARIVYAGVQNLEAPLSNAGVITSAAASRQLQLALKLLF